MKAKTMRPRIASIARASLAALLAALIVQPSPVLAQRPHRAGPSHWRGDISRFHEHDWGVWRGGRWLHQRHGGRVGWWWVAGGLWYPYPAPVYPYPSPWVPPAVTVMPPVRVVPAAPPTQYWYYCEASRNYYPYVASCPGGWKEVPAKPADASATPQ